MKNLILVIVFFSISVVSFSQNELVIEVFTDNYADETSWSLYDSENNLIQSRVEFENEQTHFDTLSIPEGKCYYWTIYDKYSDGMSSANGGYFKLYLDGELFASLSEPNFGDSLSVYSLGSSCSANDIELQKITTLEYVSKDYVPLSFTVLNRGVQVINSIEYSYSVNSFTSESITLSGLSIDLASIEEIVIPESYLFDEAGEYVFSVEITKVNDQADTYTANNNLQKVLTVVDGYLKKNLFEAFTTSWCVAAGCYSGYANFIDFIGDYKGTYSLISYMVYEDSDNHWFPEVTLLKEFYGANGLPNIRLNFPRVGFSSPFGDEEYQDSLGLISPLKITIDAKGKGDSLQVTAKIIASENLMGTYILRGIITENKCNKVGMDNGDYPDFDHVAIGSLTGFNELEIENFTQGDTLEYNFTKSFDEFFIENSESFQEMEVVFYVQDKIYRNILQSETAKINYADDPWEITYNFEDGALDIDTVGFIVEIESNRKLYDIDGNPFILINDHVELYKNAAQGTPIPFKATLNENKNKITIKPEYGWEANATYFVKISDFSTIDGKTLELDIRNFKTKSYVGNNQLSNLGISIYPNPTKNQVNILLTNSTEITICNINGQQIKTVSAVKGYNNIDLSNFSAGVYLISFTSANIPYKIRLIKE